MNTKHIVAIATLSALALSAPLFVQTIPNGSVGVKSMFGKVYDEVYTPGLILKAPWIDFRLVSTFTQKLDTKTDAVAAGTQKVLTEIVVTYSINPDATPKLLREYGNNSAVEEKIVRPNIITTLKSVTATYPVEEIASKREQVESDIHLKLKTQLGVHGVVVESVSLTNISFTEAFQEALDAKAVAQQAKLTAEYELQTAKVSAEQKIVRAEADAKALALQRQQLSPEVLKLRELENIRTAIDKWNGVLPTTSGGAVPFINVK